MAFFSLFGSLTTLLCCALPATLVALGMGSVMAGLVGTFPQMVWISRHKPEVFGAAALLLFLGGILQWRARNAPCPLDPDQARACDSARRLSIRIYWVSVVLFAIGAFFAFVLQP
jgi:hypothetical protein